MAQLKEAVLAYGMLLTKEAEMTQELLDENCETFLAKYFNLKVWGLVGCGYVRRGTPFGKCSAEEDVALGGCDAMSGLAFLLWMLPQPPAAAPIAGGLCRGGCAAAAGGVGHCAAEGHQEVSRLPAWLHARPPVHPSARLTARRTPHCIWCTQG